MGTSTVDNSPGVTTAHWSPPLQVVVVAWLLAAAAAAGVAYTAQPAGQVLLGIAALALALMALHGSVARPRVAAGEKGVAVRGLLGTRHLSWSGLQVRVRRTRRLGRVVSTLELESDETMLVLGRIDLGVDPEDAAEELLALRPH